jgi:hypothetical protein
MHGVDPIGVPPERDGERPHQSDDTVLGGDVVIDVRIGSEAANRAGQDDRTPRPPEIICGTAALTVFHTPERFTSTLRTVASVVPGSDLPYFPIGTTSLEAIGGADHGPASPMAPAPTPASDGETKPDASAEQSAVDGRSPLVTAVAVGAARTAKAISPSDWTFGRIDDDLLPCLCDDESADDEYVRDEGVNDEGQSWGLVSDEGHHHRAA